MNRVDVIIVNYRTPALAVDCLRSIAEDRWLPEHGHVFVVDNASGDGSFEHISAAVLRHGWDCWVTVLAAFDNGGFAAGNNVGIRRAFSQFASEMPDYFLLLNPDTIVKPGAIAELVNFLDTHGEAGIAGARLLDLQGRVQKAAHRFPSPLNELQAAARFGLVDQVARILGAGPLAASNHGVPTPHEADWVTGAALMIRATLVQHIGLLDERFFLYFEEVDWCRRAKAAGAQVWHVPAAAVVHLEGASTQERHVGDSARWQSARRRYYHKHHTAAQFRAANVCRWLGLMIHRARAAMRLGRGAAYRAVAAPNG